MFDMDSRPTIEKSVVESADSGIESADCTADYASNPLRIGLWVRAFILKVVTYFMNISSEINLDCSFHIYIFGIDYLHFLTHFLFLKNFSAI